MKAKLGALVACIALAAAAHAADADRRFIHTGMSEGDVLVKIGKPDTESIDSGGGAKVVVKRWIYLPSPGDPQMLTTITIREGQVVDVDRRMSR